MAHFQADTSAEPGRVVVALTGECDLSGREELTSVLLSAVSHRKPVFVDLSGLAFIDSSGVHSLVTAHHAAREAGERLYVVNAVGPVARVLDLTGIAELLSPPADGEGNGAGHG